MSKAWTDTRPRIGFVTKVFPKLSESFVLEEVLGLENAGLALEVVALHGADDKPRHARAARVHAPIHYAPTAGWLYWQQRVYDHAAQITRTPWLYLRNLSNIAFAQFDRAVWLAQLAKRRNLTRLHVHFANEPTAIAVLAAAFAGIEFSVSCHAKDLYCEAPAELRKRLSAASFVTTCTAANYQYLRDTVRPACPVLRVYHGIDTDFFAPAPASVPPAAVPQILAVGRLRRKKGFHTLLDAIAALRARGLPVKCTIIGYGPEQANLAAQAELLQISECVTLEPAIPHEALIERYTQASLFCLPCEVQDDGDRDGIPNVMLEAMAVALPVISTPISGIPEVVRDGENGWLVPPGDSTALANAIEKVLALSPTARQVVGLQARATVQAMFNGARNVAVLAKLLSRAPGAAVPDMQATLADGCC